MGALFLLCLASTPSGPDEFFPCIIAIHLSSSGAGQVFFPSLILPKFS
jgi:hypothetical protein